MHWGLFYLPAWLPERPEEGAERYRTILSQVSYAEELGFESVWLADSQVRLSMRRFVEQVAPRRDVRPGGDRPDAGAVRVVAREEAHP